MVIIFGDGSNGVMVAMEEILGIGGNGYNGVNYGNGVDFW